MGAFFSNIFESISGFFMQIFMALLDIRIPDIIDMLIIAYIIYKAIGFFKETRAKILVKGILLLLVVWVLAQSLELISLKWILVKFFDYAIIAVAIIFQPELRHALERVGHSSFGWFGSGNKTAKNSTLQKCIDDTCRACAVMQEQRIGALIVFERSTPLGEIIATGTEIDAGTSQELLGNIFYPKSPLHDGGLVIRDGRIAAAGCILPLTSNNALSKELGTRHRAAVGMSESSDAIVVVVSEETGIISVCSNGVIKRDYNQISLRERLYSDMLTFTEEGKSNFLSKFFKRKDKSADDEQ